jgi:hypothetical protein
MKTSVLLVLAAAAGVAQDVGMGVRKGSGTRFEAPYTFDVATPHEKWANPLPGGPIRLLAVPTVQEGRTVVELAQRLSLDLTTVTIDSAWDRNKWTMAFGRDYGARARGDLSLIYSYLEAELTSDKHFDAILLPVNHGWEALSERSRQAIERRLRDGAGLVMLRPLGNLSPLTAEAPARGGYAVVEPEHVPAAAWTRTAEHYITRAIPVESFPFKHLAEYRYTPLADAQVLIKSATGNPTLAVRRFGKGRIAAFGFRNHGMSWMMPLAARLDVSAPQWEYYYALLVRAIIWAADREPAAPPAFDKGLWRLKSFDGAVKQSGKGSPPAFGKLSPGVYFVEQQAESDFRIRAIEIPQPARVDDVRATPEVIAEGATVAVEWKGTPDATVELVDGFDRVIGRAAGNRAATMRAGRPLTHWGFVRVSAGSAAAKAPVKFAASSRQWEDYEVIMPWYGPGGYHPWIPALDEQFRRAGITTLSSAERNFKLIASAGLHDTFGVYFYRNQNYAARKKAYFETKDKKYLTRDGCCKRRISSPSCARSCGSVSARWLH